MRVAMMGSGGLGGFFGGILARAGADVTFIARGANLETLRTVGVTVKLGTGDEFRVPVRATDRPDQVGPVDLVWFCVKAYDIDAAARQIMPLVGPDTMVLPVQNGVDAAERIAAVVGPRPVLGGMAPTGATLVAPGTVVQKDARTPMVFGEMGGGVTPRAERLLEALLAIGVEAELSPDIEAAIWQKFVAACGFIGLTTLTRLPIGPLVACSETRDLLRGVMKEVETVGQAEGKLRHAGAADRALTRLEGTAPSARGSMYFDLVAGRRLELEDLNGAAVRLGLEHDVPTPLNRAVYAAVKPYADGTPQMP